MSAEGSGRITLVWWDGLSGPGPGHRLGSQLLALAMLGTGKGDSHGAG